MAEREKMNAATSGPARASGAEPATGVDALATAPDPLDDGTLLDRMRRQPERFVGPAISVVVHLILLIIAAILVINPPVRRGEGPGEAPIEFAMLNDEELDELTESPFDALDSPIAADLAETTPIEIEFNADVAPTEFEASASQIDALGAAGESIESSEALSGGGGGASFFGVEASGKRFVYIVDVSGSMLTGGRMTVLERNLHQSIENLAPYTSFFIIAYSDRANPIESSPRWIKADDAGKLKARGWIRKLAPGGGTEPADAFAMAFEFNPRPDVIYFMTDGDIPQGDSLAMYIESQNRRGRKTRINTIGFGYRGSEDLLRRIAKDSGGKFRFVASGEGGN